LSKVWQARIRIDQSPEHSRAESALTDQSRTSSETPARPSLTNLVLLSRSSVRSSRVCPRQGMSPRCLCWRNMVGRGACSVNGLLQGSDPPTVDYTADSYITPGPGALSSGVVKIITRRQQDPTCFSHYSKRLRTPVIGDECKAWKAHLCPPLACQ
jgi:hypothetical protein